MDHDFTIGLMVISDREATSTCLANLVGNAAERAPERNIRQWPNSAGLSSSQAQLD
jgi:hypothetical protein